MRSGFVLMAVGALLLATPVIAGHVAGRASVIDGDTIEIRSQRIRISGVDAPEAGQVCYTLSGRQWRCGQRAAFMLADHLGTGPVSCRTEGQDRYGRWLARCTAHRQDLGEWLVRNGWAVPYFDHNHAYAEAQRAARASRAGIWAGQFTLPKDWRKLQRNYNANALVCAVECIYIDCRNKRHVLMATPILPIRMPIPLRRGLEREAERSGRSLTEIIIEAVQKSGIEPVVHEDEIAPEAVRVPPAFFDFQAQHGGVPVPLARTSKHVSLRLDDPALPSFIEGARRCVADESQSLGLRKSARATINILERLDK